MSDVDAVLFDLGGVLIDGPFEAFARYEREHDLPSGFIRRLNATNHNDNAWARFERSELSFDEFCASFEEEANSAGGSVDAQELFGGLSGSTRPQMIEAVRRCSERFKTGLLTNNFVSIGTPGSKMQEEYVEVVAMFDVVIESSVAGIRKPDPRFYLLACEKLAIEPHQAVFLDDLGVNLKPARELGMVTIKVTDADSALDELERVVGIPLR